MHKLLIGTRIPSMVKFFRDDLMMIKGIIVTLIFAWVVLMFGMYLNTVAEDATLTASEIRGTKPLNPI
jgi:hypothetical protein